jgi:hypothetical protein
VTHSDFEMLKGKIMVLAEAHFNDVERCGTVWNKQDCRWNMAASLLFIILMGSSEAFPKTRVPSLKKRWTSCQHVCRTTSLFPFTYSRSVSICFKPNLLTVYCNTDVPHTAGEKRCGSVQTPEEHFGGGGGGVISLSQSWSVLSPSFTVCSASVPFFSRITLLKRDKRWGEMDNGHEP